MHPWKFRLIGINPDPPFAPYSPLLTSPARSAILSTMGPVVAPAALSEGTGTLQPWEKHTAWFPVHPAPIGIHPLAPSPPSSFLLPIHLNPQALTLGYEHQWTTGPDSGHSNGPDPPQYRLPAGVLPASHLVKISHLCSMDVSYLRLSPCSACFHDLGILGVRDAPGLFTFHLLPSTHSFATIQPPRLTPGPYPHETVQLHRPTMPCTPRHDSVPSLVKLGWEGTDKHCRTFFHAPAIHSKERYLLNTSFPSLSALVTSPLRLFYLVFGHRRREHATRSSTPPVRIPAQCFATNQ